jgi:hypothetical protein
MMKILMLWIGLMPITVSAQSTISDTLLFSLIHQSIEAVVFEKLNIFREVMIPKPLMHSKGELARDLAYFTQDDLDGIAKQIKNPRITSWNTKTFTHDGNVNIVRDKKVDQCLFLSIPLISKDENVILIYYENRLKIRRKKFGSGTACVWKKNLSGEWIQERQQVVWTYN